MNVIQFLWIFLFTRINESICLRISSVTVPTLRAVGESASLSCEWDLDGGRLYSVKWYRDNEEFYRFMPRLRPPQHAHLLEGVTVDLHKSNSRRVHLRELTLRSRGLYRCEVSEEAPAFHSAQADAFMEVYYFPREAPVISGHERPHHEDEILEVNCTSFKAYPVPELQWHVNGQKVTTPGFLVPYDTIEVSPGLYVVKLGLRVPMKRRMRLRCIAIIATHRRERTVYLETISSSSIIKGLSQWTWIALMIVYLSVDRIDTYIV